MTKKKATANIETWGTIQIPVPLKSMGVYPPFKWEQHSEDKAITNKNYKGEILTLSWSRPQAKRRMTSILTECYCTPELVGVHSASAVWRLWLHQNCNHMV